MQTKTVNKLWQLLNNSSQINAKLKFRYKRTLNYMLRPQIVNDKNMRAIIGFDDQNNPIYWNLQKENLLLATGTTGFGAYLSPQDTILLSLLTRYSAKYFVFYYFCGDGSLAWITQKFENLKGAYSPFINGYKDPLKFLNEVKLAVNERKTMTDDQLNNQPFALIIFSCYTLGEIDNKALEDVNEIIANVSLYGKKIKVALYLCDSLGKVELSNRCGLYPTANLLKSKPCLLIGATPTASTSKKYLKRAHAYSRLYKKRHRYFKNFTVGYAYFKRGDKITLIKFPRIFWFFNKIPHNR